MKSITSNREILCYINLVSAFLTYGQLQAGTDQACTQRGISQLDCRKPILVLLQTSKLKHYRILKKQFTGVRLSLELVTSDGC